LGLIENAEGREKCLEWGDQRVGNVFKSTENCGASKVVRDACGKLKNLEVEKEELGEILRVWRVFSGVE